MKHIKNNTPSPAGILISVAENDHKKTYKSSPKNDLKPFTGLASNFYSMLRNESIPRAGNSPFSAGLFCAGAKGARGMFRNNLVAKQEKTPFSSLTRHSLFSRGGRHKKTYKSSPKNDLKSPPVAASHFIAGLQNRSIFDNGFCIALGLSNISLSFGEGWGEALPSSPKNGLKPATGKAFPGQATHSRSPLLFLGGAVERGECRDSTGVVNSRRTGNSFAENTRLLPKKQPQTRYRQGLPFLQHF